MTSQMHRRVPAPRHGKAVCANDAGCGTLRNGQALKPVAALGRGHLRARIDRKITGDLRINGDSLDEQVPSDGVQTVEGSARLGLGMRWTPIAHWQLRFRVDNLTDEEFETRLGFPGGGRAVRVGVRWQR